LHLGPAAGAAFEVAERLNDLQHAIVVEIVELHVPGPAAPGEPQRLACFHIGRHAFGELVSGRSGAQKYELPLLKTELGGDVADEYVRNAVAVEIGKVDAHALERVASDHLGRWLVERALARDQLKAHAARSRSIPKQPIRTEVVCHIELRQQIAV